MITTRGTSGSSHDFFFFDASNNVWNGTTAFVAWVDANYTTYRRAATELGATGNFYITNYPNGATRWELRLRAGTLAASTVVAIGSLDAPIDYATVVRPTRIAGRDSFLFPSAYLSGGTAGRTLVQTGINLTIGRGISSVSRIKLYTYTAVYPGVIKFLVFRGGIKVQESDLFQIPETVTGQLIFDLPIALELDQGDKFGIYHLTSDNNDTAIGVTTSTGSVIKYENGDLSTLAGLTSTVNGFEFLMELLGDGPDVAYTGDSIVEGNGTANPNFGHFQDAVAAWQYPQASTPYWINRWTGLTHHNLCKGSQTFAWVLSTGVPACVAANPKSILIHCGVNDINLGRSWASVLSDLNAIRVLVPMTVHLLLDEILPWSNGSPENAVTVRTFNANLAAWCLANHATLVRCHDAFKDPSDPDNMIDELDSDGVHLSMQGVLKLARLQADAILGQVTTSSIDNSAALAKNVTVNNLMGLL
jgi:lysophospholipase L1-like esterase